MHFSKSSQLNLKYFNVYYMLDAGSERILLFCRTEAEVCKNDGIKQRRK